MKVLWKNPIHQKKYMAGYLQIKGRDSVGPKAKGVFYADWMNWFWPKPPLKEKKTRSRNKDERKTKG